MSSQLKPIHIKPVTGFLDVRSSADDVPFGGYRWAMNWESPKKNGMCRLVGWRKLLDGPNYNNADFHDQLMGLDQFITTAFVSEFAGYSKLFIASQNKIAALNTETQNWKIISNRLGGDPVTGCGETRWYAASEGDTVVFTNGIDPVQFHIIDQPPIEPADQSVAEIPDMAKLKITKVGRVVSWNHLMFYFNLEIDGRRETNMIIWSDYKRPLSIVPKAGVSLAGRKFLDDGEVVLNAEPIGKNLVFYTTRGIWVVAAVAGDQVLSFDKRWEGARPGDKCLVYPNTLVSTGSRHFYWSLDGIYAYDFYMADGPERIDWIHRASSRIFDDINDAKCAVHVGGYNQRRKCVIWSWAKKDDDCPSESFIVNTEFPWTSYVDAGFSAFANWGPDRLKTLRSFILEHCVCSTADLNANASGFVMEGGFCYPQSDPTCPITPQSFYTNTPATEDDVTTEDLAQVNADANSLWAILGDMLPADICDAEALSEQCNASDLFVMASVKDKCLKEVADVYYREVCTGHTGCGTYQLQGYQSILRSGANDLRQPDLKKIVEQFGLEAQTIDQVVPSKIGLRVGVASQAVDPNEDGGRCVIMWQQQDPLLLECKSDLTAAEHEAAGTYPDDDYSWPPFMSGRYFYFELTVYNDEVTPADTGGALCISRITYYVRAGSD